MSIPWENITAGAAVGSLVLNWAKQEGFKWSLLGFFVVLWLVGIVLWAIWAIWIYPLFVSPLRHLPQPSGNHWLFGQFKRIMAEPSGIPMREWVNEIHNDGIIRYRGMFNQERILVCSPKALAEVLVTNNYAFEKPSQVKWSIGRILGIGVLLAEGDEHKMQRRSLTPAFAFRHVKNLYPVFWRKAREATQAMTAVCSGQEVAEVEVAGWASRATLDIIGVAGMGRDFGAIQDENGLLVNTYRKVFKPTTQAQMLALLGLFIPAWFLNRLPVKRNEDINGAAQEIRAVCRDLIKEKKAKLANKEQPDVDILSVALESGGFTDENLVDQLMTFLAAGHETTASAMTWAIYMLARNPDVQSRLREEIRERLPSVDSDVDITSIDIDRMPYLNAVCSEVLRYYSPVPLTLREAAYDTTILGHPVRKGTRVMLAPWATNFDNTLWGPDAAQFNPDRWMPQHDQDGNEKTGDNNKSGGATSNYAFLTFLHGPRSCIGSSFARAEFACLLAGWIGRFEFALQNPEDADEKKLVIKGGITARPSGGLNCKVKVIGGY
ncbi:Fc.00g063740.m01.CDS01 [Cosmosporella sp. VM-42]